MRFTARLPDGGRIAYGFDAALGGFWGELKRRGERLMEYDALHPKFDWARPLDGVLHFFVEAGAFTEAELNDALLHVEGPGGRLVGEGTQLAYEVVVNLKRAASN